MQLCFANDSDEDAKSVEFSFCATEEMITGFSQNVGCRDRERKVCFLCRGSCTLETTIARKGYKIVDYEAAQGRYKLMKQHDIHGSI